MISLDSEGPFLSPGQGDPKEWFVFALAGFFFIMACFGCLLMCAQGNYVFVDENNVIHIGPRAVVDANRRAQRNDVPLLTEGQVLSFPEIEYTGFGDYVSSPKDKSICDEKLRQDKWRHRNEDMSSVALDDPSEPLLDHNSHTACSICLENYEVGEMVRVLPCRHVFHTDCIVPWLTTRASCCPLCKADIIDNQISHGDGRSQIERSEHSSSV